MSCERFSEAIVDHACGAPIDDASAAHLAACGACRETFDEHRNLLAQADEDLRDALALKASPEFIARVSTRAARVRQPAAWHREWWLGVATAAGIAVAVYLAAPGSRLGPQPSPQRPAGASVNLPVETNRVAVASPEHAQPPTPTQMATSRPSSAAKSNPPMRRIPGVQPRNVPQPELEVIVPPGQARALARLRELLRQGMIDPAALPVERVSAELSITPISIPDLLGPDASDGIAPAVREGGDRR